MTSFIRVSEDEGGECIEIPVEDDGTLYLSTLVAQYPGACGLKYRNPDTRTLRGVKLIEDRLICPDEGWVYDFFCTFPKTDSKRKSSEVLESSSTKTKRLDFFSKCTDLIVLDLPYKTTETEMKNYFSSYGNVVMSQVKKDPKTGQGRGYGFIRFDDIEAQRAVLSCRHSIGGRNCEVRIPKSKDSSNPYLGGKVFVGRITEDFSENDLRDYFSKYGEISYIFIPKKPFRAFSFVTFVDPFAAQEVCEQEDHIIKGVSCCVSTAKSKREHGDPAGPAFRNGGLHPNSGGYSNSGGYPSSGGYPNSGGYSGGSGFNMGGGSSSGFGGNMSGGYGTMSGSSGGGFSGMGSSGGSFNANRGGGFSNGGSRRKGNYGGHGNDWGGRGNWNDSFDSGKLDYEAIAAPIVAAITQQLGGLPPNLNQPPPPGPHPHY
ncbi:RNA recognition motif domain [Trinorchestia longiramus]|nr:RNA recognition motif domain [Trinorchestia longiramus]